MTATIPLVIAYVMMQATIPVDAQVYEMVKYILLVLLTFVGGLGIREMSSLRKSVDNLRSEVTLLRSSIDGHEQDIRELKGGLSDVRDRVTSMASDLHSVREDVNNLKKRKP